jgi:hypothetical protein
MSDANLLIFGCAVSFIAVAGAYAYVRERFLASEQPMRVEPATLKRARRPLREVA